MITTQDMWDIKEAQSEFARLIKGELERIERVRNAPGPKDFSKLDKIVVGIFPGDGIGPVIMAQALRVMRELLAPEIESGHVELRQIDGLTIEDRVAAGESLPADVLERARECDVLIKGPFVTPHAGDGLPNFLSANSLLRRSLDLYAAVRPIKIPKIGADWTFFRENIEGEYIWGNKGIQVNDDLAVDFKVLTRPGSDRLARAVFDYCRKNDKHSITLVTKANIVKLTDGNFIKAFERVGQEYPGITVQERYVDATCAKMGDPEFTRGMEVFALPNLYGDIVTDTAAELSGGLGTASSSNVGDQYALFEAIHGTAPALCEAGLADYANPCSLIRAAGQLMVHIGYGDRNRRLEEALDVCLGEGARVRMTGNRDGASAAQFTDYLLETIRAQQ